MEEPQTHICSLCGREFFGFGNNPEPLAELDERCCNECNGDHVIPARLLYVAANTPEEIAKVEQLVAERRENLRALRAQRPAG